METKRVKKERAQRKRAKTEEAARELALMEEVIAEEKAEEKRVKAVRVELNRDVMSSGRSLPARCKRPTSLWLSAVPRPHFTRVSTQVRGLQDNREAGVVEWLRRRSRSNFLQ